MATFKYYNIQVLPLDGKEENLIGEDGYKKIFEAYSQIVNERFRKRDLLKISHSLKNDFQISFKRIDIKEGYAQGRLIKFNHVDKLIEVYTDEEVYNNKDKLSIASSKRIEFDFVFDFKKHIFAISSKNGLPSENVLIDAITSLLNETAKNLYTEHYIKMIELSDAASLEKVIDEADGYKKVAVEITFSNSFKFEEGIGNILDEIDKDSRENNIQSISATQRPPKDKTSKSISMVLMPLIVLSTKLGNTDITYTKDGKEINYHMRDYPVRVRVNRSGKMTDDEYYNEVLKSIVQANMTAEAAHSINASLKNKINDK